MITMFITHAMLLLIEQVLPVFTALNMLTLQCLVPQNNQTELNVLATNFRKLLTYVSPFCRISSLWD